MGTNTGLHFGFIGSIVYNALAPWYTTTDNDEIVEMFDADGFLHEVNALTIFANTTALYVRMLPGKHCIYIPASGSLSIDYLPLTKFQVLGNAGQELRWYAAWR